MLDFADGRTTGGGQVGAPCGCIGCFDSFDNIQGNWVHQRHGHRGRFKAKDFNSLRCGCEACGEDNVSNVKKLDGNLCNDNSRVCGPTPPNAPANLACFSGTGTWSPTSGSKDRVEVAFRVEVEDHSEPGVNDEYRIWIYIPASGETIKSLAVDICCQNAPSDNSDRSGDQFGAGRAADVFDGGVITHGNLQIHPQIASHIGQCPVPNGMCPASLP